jgi:starvation-inducible DNA-binding protein
MHKDFSVEKPELVQALANSLSNAVVLYFKAHGHHWNVVGSDFSQFHDFFQEIYEDIYSSLDPLAEDIRKLGAVAPYRLVQFARMADIQDTEVGQNAMGMCKDLYDSNEIMLRSLNNTFAVTNAANEQGIANFLSERIDMHQKWRWQLNAFLTSEDTVGQGF